MSVLEQSAMALLAILAVVAVLRIVAAPAKLVLRLSVNTALGFGALWLLQRTAAVTGFPLGLSLFNAVTVGVLGLPGLGLLLALHWVLT